MDELSTSSPAAADAAALTARATARDATAVRDRVDVAVAALEGWYGPARDGFSARVSQVRDELDALSSTAAAGAALIEEHARRLSMLRAKLAGIDAETARLQRRVDAGVVDLAAWQGDWAQLERWQDSRHRVLAEFDQATEEFAARLFAVLDQVPHRPRRLGEHVDDAAATVAASAGDAAFLALGWTEDGPGWRAAWQQVPAAAVDAATHPVATLADAVAWDDWTQGRYGAGAATLGMAAVGRGIGRGIGRGAPPGVARPAGRRWGRHLDARGNPLPQSLEDLLAGVDLERSEVFPSAHTLSRHVEVDDEFLRNRLRTGEVEGGAVRRAPDTVSRWKDRETAEEVVTAALRTRRAGVEAAAGTGVRDVRVEAPAPADSGTIWTRSSGGEAVRRNPSRVVVVLTRADDGSWFVRTSYLEV